MGRDDFMGFLMLVVVFAIGIGLGVAHNKYPKTTHIQVEHQPNCDGEVKIYFIDKEEMDRVKKFVEEL